MKPVDVLLLGCGDIGTEIALHEQSRGRSVLAVRRNIESLPEALPALSLDYSDPDAVVELARQPAGAVVFTPTPAGRGADGYRQGYLAPVLNLLNAWRDLPPRKLVYVSSTRVYGDQGGAWVDESTPLAPADEQAEILCEAEARLLESHHQVCVVRFSGIYGRLPSRLLERIARGEIVRAEPPHFSNRIHREDCIGFLLHLLEQQAWSPVYLASDDAPTLSHEVESWLAEKLGVESPRESVAPPSASRRCSNRSMKETGFGLKYPDYRAGYSAIMTSTSMSAPLGSAAT